MLCLCCICICICIVFTVICTFHYNLVLLFSFTVSCIYMYIVYRCVCVCLIISFEVLCSFCCKRVLLQYCNATWKIAHEIKQRVHVFSRQCFAAVVILILFFCCCCCFYRSTYMVYVYEQVSTAMELSRLIYAYKNDDNDNGNNGDHSVIIKLFHRKVESICTFSCIRTLYISNVYEVMGKKHGRSCSPQFFSV